MNHKRIMPVLLLSESGLVKGSRFKNHKYVGDPINAVRIFNDKEVDELILIDITARINGKINYELLSDICSEAFMPFSYGGGVSSLYDLEKLFKTGVEKVILNTEAVKNINFVREATQLSGSQSISVCVDIKRNIFGKYEVFFSNGKIKSVLNFHDYLRALEDNGVGEIIVQDIDREGTYSGFDYKLFDEISSRVSVPVIASGGPKDLHDVIRLLKDSQVSGVAIGSLFIFHGKHRAVLITYPNRSEIHYDT